jgi:hypothetical protein
MINHNTCIKGRDLKREYQNSSSCRFWSPLGRIYVRIGAKLMSTKNVFQFDEKVDYYAVLQVELDATAEEIKAAHVQMALKYHPDTADSGNDLKQSASQFRRIQEAFQVIGDPVIRDRYNDARYGAKPLAPNFDAPSSDVPAGSYGMQKANYARVKREASSNWMDIKQKYKTEAWQDLPLSKRKASRIRPIAGVGTSLVIMFGTGVFFVGGIATLYYYSTKPKYPVR